MLELFINTASSRTHFYCAKEGSVLIEKNWETSNNEASALLPQIKESFDSNGLNLNDVQKIITIKGPGSFTGVRIGVTIANVLAFTLKAELYTTDLFTLLDQKLPEQSGTIIVKAGKNEVYVKNPSDALESIQIHPFTPEVLSRCDEIIWGDLTEAQESQLEKWLSNTPEKKWIPYSQLKSDFEAVQSVSLEKVNLVKPLYIKTPNITMSKKNS